MIFGSHNKDIQQAPDGI